MSGLALCVVLIGFARTYYLKKLFGPPPLPLPLHVHGFALALIPIALATARQFVMITIPGRVGFVVHRVR